MSSNKLSALNSKTTSYDSNETTDDVHADMLGLKLQKECCEQNLKELKINYKSWTKWGAHEIASYLETTTSLERIGLKHHPSRVDEDGIDHDDVDNDDDARRDEEYTMTSARTLACLLGALVSNPHNNLKSLELDTLTLEEKSIVPFCQLLHSSLTLEELTIRKGFQSVPSDFTRERVSTAFQGDRSLRKIVFCLVPAHFYGEGNPFNPKKIEITGLEILLKSPKCTVDCLQFTNVGLQSCSTEALFRGLSTNTSVNTLQCCTACIFDEEVLGRIFSETTGLQSLRLSCALLNKPTFDGIRALRNNTSITTCVLTGLTKGCGGTLRDVLANNHKIRILKLDGNHHWQGHFHISGGMLENDDIQLIAAGLKSNHCLEDICLEDLNIDRDGLGYIADAMCPREEHLDRTFSLVRLSITSNVIVDTGLLPFARVMGMPGCRLQSFQCGYQLSSAHATGLISLMSALAENKSLETLQIEATRGANETIYLGYWSAVQSFADCLFKIKFLRRLILDFGMDPELRFESSGFKTIWADLLKGSKANTSLEHLEFGREVYRSRTPREKTYWAQLSFYGMRNKLNHWMEELDTRQEQQQQQQQHDSSQLLERLEISRSLCNGAMETQKPWTLPIWRGFAKRTNDLNQLSLDYICLRRVPHQIVVET